MPLGTAHQTASTGVHFRPTVWANDVQSILEANLVLLNLVKRYDHEVTQKGQAINVPFVSNATASDKQPGSQVSLNGQTATTVTINIDKHKESSYVIEDFLKIQSAYDLRSEYTKAAAYAISQSIDTAIFSEFKTGVTKAVGTFGTAITDAIILKAKTELDWALAPLTERSLVLNPDGIAQMLAIDKYVRYDALGTGQAIKDAKMGTIYGLNVYMSQNLAPVVPATGPTEHTGMMFHKDNIGVAVQQKPRVQAQYKQEYLGWLLTVDTIFGLKTLRADFGVKVKY